MPAIARRVFVQVAAIGLIVAGAGFAQVPADLADASLEQLMNIDVTSASKKEQKLSKVPAAIYVLSQEDIRRSGATSIAAVLRMVPGMDVAEVSGHSWAVSARGFNNIWTDKLLVLIDGRSVYNPALSGTLWDTQDVPLLDVERIEVIRGPGATVWGANAVNGVINIITKSSKDTGGGLLQVAAGSQLIDQTLVQYGGSAGRLGNYRIFGNTTWDRANPSNVLGGAGRDAGRISHFGFRSDWQLSSRDALLVEGDTSASEVKHTYDSFYSYTPPYRGNFADAATSHGADILTRWTRTLSPGSSTALQFYYDRVSYANFGIHQTVATADLDFQNHLAAGSRNDIVWGLDGRFQPDTILPGYSASFYHPHHLDWLTSVFLQDEIRLTDRLWLTAGTKFEHNSYTGFNLQPSLRLLWAPDKRNSLWAATSRALREPARQDTDVRYVSYVTTLPSQLPVFAIESGNPSIRAEALSAFEGGYRFEPNKRLSLDISTFYNVYTDLLSSDPAGYPSLTFDPPPVHLVFPQIFDNGLRARTYGGEVSAVVNVSKRWKVSPAYSLLLSKFSSQTPSSVNPYALQGDAPRHQFQIRSYTSFHSNFEFDTFLYYVSSLINQHVPAYVRLDARLGWRISDSFDLSVVGQNLADPHHEFGQNFATLSIPTNIGRKAYLRGTWHF